MANDKYSDLLELRLQWVDVEDYLATQRAIIEVTPGMANLELPRGRRGEKGEKGDAGAAAMFRYPVASRDDLPTNLTEFDQGAAFPDVGSRSLWIWDGGDWSEVPEFIGVPGETGATPEFVIGSVTMGGGPIVSVDQASSTEERVVLDFQLPQGPRGPEGPEGPPGDSAAIVEAPDYDNAQPPTTGDAIVWNGTKWQPSQVTQPVGPWIMGPSQFTRQIVGFGQGGEYILGTLTIPGLPFDWRPVVLGGQLFFKISGVTTRVNGEVRLGNASTGTRIGMARGHAGASIHTPAIVVPYSDTAVTPETSVDIVPANTTTSIYVVAKRVDGNGAWESSPVESSITIMAMPAVG